MKILISETIVFLLPIRYSIIDICAVFGLIVVCLVFQGIAQPCEFPVFEGGKSFPTGDSPISVTSGDVNNDGWLDIVNANFDGNSVSVLLGNGAGSFATKIDSGAGPKPVSLQLGYLDADDILDAVILNAGIANKVTVLFGDGTGHFTFASDFELIEPRQSTLVDIDGDSDLDIVAVSGNSAVGRVNIFKNDGAGSFGNPSELPISGGAPSGIGAGDFNQDSHTDLVLAKSSQLTVWSGDGTGNFIPGWEMTLSSGRITVGKFDSDIFPDLMVLGSSATLLTGNGDGSFTRRGSYRVGSVPGSPIAADVNLDHIQDYLTSNFASNEVSVLISDGNGSFRPAINYTTSSESNGTAVGDFNSDGFPDVVTASAKITLPSGRENSIRLTLGRGDGTFRAPVNYPHFQDAFPNAVEVTDVNHDGKDDIISANGSGWGFSIFIRNGEFSFDPPRNFLQSRYVNNLVVKDINDDGNEDLVGVGENNIYTFLGDGVGNFVQTEAKVTGSFLLTIAVVDINADSKLDVVVGDRDWGRFTTFLGNGDGTFGPGTDYIGENDPVVDLVVGDFNSDSRPDLAIVYDTFLSLDSKFRVWINQGNGSFQAGASYSFGVSFHPNAIDVGDMNADGRPDLVVSVDYDPSLPAHVRQYLGNGNGTFSPLPLRNVEGWHPNDVVLHDFNDDGKLDMAVTNDGSETVSIFGGDGLGGMAINQRLSAGEQAKRMAVGNLNNDTSPDIIVANYNGSSLTIFPNGCHLIWQSSRHAPFDFDGDGKTDASVFRPAGGEWWWQPSSGGSAGAAQFGSGTDIITPGDFTGDGKADSAVFRPSTGQWFILKSEDFSYYAFPFGAAGDVPIAADMDGDGKADPVIFRPSTGVWYTMRSSDSQITTSIFGGAGDVPAVADYDGDGKDDVAVFRPNGASGAEWWYVQSSDGLLRAFSFGIAGDKAVPGDYTGDGKADVAFYRPSTGQWFVLQSEDFGYYAFPFGAAGDIPVPGDYDGDGRFDAAVFRPSDGNWYVNGSTAGVMIQHFGGSGDLPVPNAYVH